MYEIKCKNLRDAVARIYRFLSDPELTMPECTIWSEKSSISPLRRGKDYKDEASLYRRIESSGGAIIVCVASTDKADSRRVSLNYVVELNTMVINFPMSGGNPNKDEMRLIRALSA